MKVTLKLFATLTDYLPPESRHSNVVALELAHGSCIGQVIEQYRLPEKLVHLVLLNGIYIEPENRARWTLSEGDVLAIWPAIAGG